MRQLRFASVVLATAAAVAPHVFAQETYWIANRGSSDIMEIDQTGKVLQTVPMGNSLRSCHVAPDGKIWVVRFIQSTVDVLNPDGTPFTTVSCALGSAFDIAFDSNGHAWISGGSGVEEFDANGVTQGTVALNTASPLGITIDADNNKWVAHRIGPPGSISRIDGTTNAVTVHVLPATSLILPTRCYADRRGVMGASHIWVIGDNRGAGELVEFDATGTHLNTYVLDVGGNFGSIISDIGQNFTTENIYVGDFRNGNVWRVDAATGMATSMSVASDVIGLNIDGFANIWATTRTTTQVMRLDPTTLALEALTTVGSGVQSAISTGWHYATTIDPFGDLDGDGEVNAAEVLGGSSPFDGCSTAASGLAVEGTSSIGFSTTLKVRGPAGSVSGIVFATGTLAAPISLPGFACAIELDPATALPFSLTVNPPVDVVLMIPAAPVLVGQTLYTQSLNLATMPTVLRFTNTTGWTFF